MKQISLISGISLISLIACSTPEPQPTVEAPPPPPAPLAAFDSLLGTWVDSTSSKKYTVYEEWSKTNDSLLTGLGCAVAGRDTVFLENLTIARRGTDVLYSARIASQNDGEWVSFTKTEGSTGTLAFKNDAHDWPQRIAYEKQANGWRVEVSGKENDSLRTEEFRFARR